MSTRKWTGVAAICISACGPATLPFAENAGSAILVRWNVDGTAELVAMDAPGVWVSSAQVDEILVFDTPLAELLVPSGVLRSAEGDEPSRPVPTPTAVYLATQGSWTPADQVSAEARAFRIAGALADLCLSTGWCLDRDRCQACVITPPEPPIAAAHPVQAEPPRPGTCPPGFSPLTSGLGCDVAWAGPCAAAEFPFIDGCRSLDLECTEDPFGDLQDPSYVYVDPSGLEPGDGSRASPFSDLESALAIAPNHSTLALAPGLHSATIDESVRLLGTCAETRVLLWIRSGDVDIEGLTVQNITIAPAASAKVLRSVFGTPAGELPHSLVVFGRADIEASAFAFQDVLVSEGATITFSEATVANGVRIDAEGALLSMERSVTGAISLRGSHLDASSVLIHTDELAHLPTAARPEFALTADSSTISARALVVVTGLRSAVGTSGSQLSIDGGRLFAGNRSIHSSSYSHGSFSNVAFASPERGIDASVGSELSVEDSSFESRRGLTASRGSLIKVARSTFTGDEALVAEAARSAGVTSRVEALDSSVHCHDEDDSHGFHAKSSTDAPGASEVEATRVSCDRCKKCLYAVGPRALLRATDVVAERAGHGLEVEDGAQATILRLLVRDARNIAVKSQTRFESLNSNRLVVEDLRVLGANRERDDTNPCAPAVSIEGTEAPVLERLFIEGSGGGGVQVSAGNRTVGTVVIEDLEMPAAPDAAIDLETSISADVKRVRVEQILHHAMEAEQGATVNISDVFFEAAAGESPCGRSKNDIKVALHTVTFGTNVQVTRFKWVGPFDHAAKLGVGNQIVLSDGEISGASVAIAVASRDLLTTDVFQKVKLSVSRVSEVVQ
ncbi:MAG: hypothetical protein HY791_20840 [Deltaproteobacteria bacterium]|nr:hypothetical protein [Deltaproteobacteria bacterium]